MWLVLLACLALGIFFPKILWGCTQWDPCGSLFAWAETQPCQSLGSVLCSAHLAGRGIIGRMGWGLLLWPSSSLPAWELAENHQLSRVILITPSLPSPPLWWSHWRLLAITITHIVVSKNNSLNLLSFNLLCGRHYAKCSQWISSQQQLCGGVTISSSIVLARAPGHSEVDQIACGHVELEF